MADKKIRLLVQAEVKKAVQALNKVEKKQKDKPFKHIDILLKKCTAENFFDKHI